MVVVEEEERSLIKDLKRNARLAVAWCGPRNAAMADGGHHRRALCAHRVMKLSFANKVTKTDLCLPPLPPPPLLQCRAYDLRPPPSGPSTPIASLLCTRPVSFRTPPILFPCPSSLFWSALAPRKAPDDLWREMWSMEDDKLHQAKNCWKRAAMPNASMMDLQTGRAECVWRQMRYRNVSSPRRNEAASSTSHRDARAMSVRFRAVLAIPCELPCHSPGGFHPS